jgi:hypothetical protein
MESDAKNAAIVRSGYLDLEFPLEQHKWEDMNCNGDAFNKETMFERRYRPPWPESESSFHRQPRLSNSLLVLVVGSKDPQPACRPPLEEDEAATTLVSLPQASSWSMSIPAEFRRHGQTYGRVAQDAARLSPSRPRSAPPARNRPRPTTVAPNPPGRRRRPHCRRNSRADRRRCDPNTGRGDPPPLPRRAGFARRRPDSGCRRRCALGRDAVEPAVVSPVQRGRRTGSGEEGQGEAAGEIGCEHMWFRMDRSCHVFAASMSQLALGNPRLQAVCFPPSNVAGEKMSAYGMNSNVQKIGRYAD